MNSGGLAVSEDASMVWALNLEVAKYVSNERIGKQPRIDKASAALACSRDGKLPPLLGGSVRLVSPPKTGKKRGFEDPGVIGEDKPRKGTATQETKDAPKMDPVARAAEEGKPKIVNEQREIVPKLQRL